MKEKIPEITPYLHVKILDRFSNIRQDNDIPCHSFVKNWYLAAIANMCFCPSATADGLDMKNTSGGAVESSSIPLPFRISSTVSAGTDSYGLVVGSGSTAYSYTQYALASKISHGIGDGVLSYGVQVAPTVSDDDDTRSIDIVRSFYNNGSTQVDVEEIGWIHLSDISNPDNYVLMLRDVVDTTIELLAAEELEVTLTLKLVYPGTIP
jgi:hypothetical protein